MEKAVRKLLHAEHDLREARRASQRARREAAGTLLLSEQGLAFGEARALLREIAKGQDERAMSKPHYPTRDVPVTLNDKAVRKRFGDRLERGGVKLPFTVRRPAGWSYKMKGKQPVLQPHMVNSLFMISGRRLRQGVWMITLPVALQSQVITWLLIQCGPMNENHGDVALPKMRSVGTDNLQEQLTQKKPKAKKAKRHGPLRQKEVARWGSSPAKGRG